MGSDRDDRRDQCPDSAPGTLGEGFALSDLTYEQLWIDYIAVGGELARNQLEETLRTGAPISRLEHDRLAVVLNEHFRSHGLGERVPYAEDL
ncbi:hypothetical protein GCM10023321_22100 [Pseudonocardia eucalypti]|uniref:Uncharacterized protein n=1 Tax=Pseudonocardia eucalypti TaxID=648755 RepID=A0ABP9PWR2_9PSEU|nr:hypothetical protein [Pseudonocardia eucalypti]